MLTLIVVAMLGTEPASNLPTEALVAEREAMQWKRNPLFVVVPGVTMLGGGCLALYGYFLGYTYGLLSGRSSWTFHRDREPMLIGSVAASALGLGLMIGASLLRGTAEPRYTEVDDEIRAREKAEEERREAPEPGGRLPLVPNQVGFPMLRF